MCNVFVLLGAPGSGKGTQASKLKESYQAFHISTGDMLRHEVSEKTELGQKVESILNRGDLVPDELITEIFKAAISRENHEFVIADGYPRTLAQAEALSGPIASDCGLNLIPVLLDVPKEVIIKRIEDRRICPACKTVHDTIINVPKQEGICNVCQTTLERRRDDEASVVLDRFDTYQREIAPVLHFFDTNLLTVSANQAPEKVFEDLKSAIDVQLGQENV